MGATRFTSDRNLDPPIQRRVTAELICACQEFGIMHGLRAYVGVLSISVLKHVIAAAGCLIILAGEPCKMDGYDIAAACIKGSPNVLNAVRERAKTIAGILATELLRVV